MSKGRVQMNLASAPVVTCMKTLLMVFNFIFWITGIAILAIGIWTKVQLYVYMELSTVYYKEAPYILIGVGAVIVLVGSLGCCCTVKGNSFLLYLYSAFLVLIFVVELGAGIAGFVYRNKLKSGFQDGLEDALKNYKKEGYEIKTDAINGLQKGLDCCGIQDYTDWLKHYQSVPESCCRKEEKCVHTNLGRNASSLNIYTEGCYQKVVDFMDGNLGLIGGVALGVSFFQLFGAVLSCCLAKSINKAKYEQVA